MLSIEPGAIYIGQTVRFVVDCVDDAGGLVDPGTVKFRFISPCGVETAFTYGVGSEVTRASVGRYECLTPSSMITEGGHWSYRVETTANVSVAEGYFSVQASPFYDMPRRAYSEGGWW